MASAPAAGPRNAALMPRPEDVLEELHVSASRLSTAWRESRPATSSPGMSRVSSWNCSVVGVGAQRRLVCSTGSSSPRWPAYSRSVVVSLSKTRWGCPPGADIGVEPAQESRPPGRLAHRGRVVAARDEHPARRANLPCRCARSWSGRRSRWAGVCHSGAVLRGINAPAPPSRRAYSLGAVAPLVVWACRSVRPRGTVGPVRPAEPGWAPRRSRWGSASGRRASALPP